jgi:hypothetical protein
MNSAATRSEPDDRPSHDHATAAGAAMVGFWGDRLVRSVRTVAPEAAGVPKVTAHGMRGLLDGGRGERCVRARGRGLTPSRVERDDAHPFVADFMVSMNARNAGVTSRRLGQ